MLVHANIRVSDLVEGFEFLAHRVLHTWHPRFGFMPSIEIPTAKRADLQYRVKQLTGRSTVSWPLAFLLRKLNPILRGWGNYFRFCRAPAGSSRASTITSGIASGGGSCRSMLPWHGRRRSFGGCRACFARRDARGGKDEPNSSSSPPSRSSVSDADGCASLIRHGSWRAGYITKGARPVRKAGIRNRRQQCRTALMLDLTLPADRPRLALSRGRHGLVEPGGIVVAAVEHDGRVLLRSGARGRAGAPRPAGDLQYRQSMD